MTTTAQMRDILGVGGELSDAAIVQLYAEYLAGQDATPPAEPVTIDQIKINLRLPQDETADDAYLSAMVTAARRACEARINRPVLGGDRVFSLSAFPSRARGGAGSRAGAVITLPTGATAIDAITYRDASGIVQTLDPASYRADLVAVPAQIAPIDSWPNTDTVMPEIRIVYTASMMAPDDLAIVGQAILLIVGNWYANREAAVVGTVGTAAELPIAVSWLLDPLRQLVIA